MTTTNTPTPRRYCVRCTGTGPFRSPKAIRCLACDDLARIERAEFTKTYHAARSRAVSRLVKQHHVEFLEMLNEERKAG